MWEQHLTTAHGGFSVRSIITYALAILIAAFLWVVASPQDTFAADAQWSGASIVYDGNTYSGPAPAQTVDKLGLEADVSAYTYIEPSGTADRKVHVLYFNPGDNATSAKGVNYRTYPYNGPNSFGNPSTAVALEIDPTAADPGTNSCMVEGGLGWIICPITNTLAGFMDWIFDILVGFLTVHPIDTSTEGAMYRAWEYMRTIANLAFIIAFLVIVYSQLTNFGVSNYGIKKLLPRIIIAAILVNVSFIICALAIDASNLLGHGVQTLFIQMRNTMVGTEGNTWDVVSWESIASFILSGGTLATAGSIALYTSFIDVGIIGSIALLLPALVTLLVAVLVALLVMAGRQAMITILTILAPLAFVAYLLPNTEKWFDKWRSTSLTMLILFPAFSVIFGGSQLAGIVIIQNADSLNLVILGMIVQVAPLFITPLLIKFSGSLLARVAGIVNNPNKGIIDRTRNFSKDRAESIKARRMATPARPGLMGAAQRAGQRMDHNRRRREGWRNAHNSMTDAYFGQSADGQNIQHYQHRASFEKEDGDTRAQERWNREVNDANGPYRARRAEHIRRQSTADLYKAETDAHGKELFEQSVMAPGHLRDLKVRQHGAEGRAKVHADNVMAFADRKLQAQIDSSDYLKDIAKNTAVMQGEAAISKDHIDARGKNALHRHIIGSKALQDTIKETHVWQQTAASNEAIVKSEAEAHWNTLKTQDPTVRRQQLRQFEKSIAAKKAEEEWNSLVQDVLAKGGAADGVGPADTTLADVIKRTQTDIDVTSKRQEQFKIEQQQNLAQLFRDDETIRLRAGGGTEEGANRVYSQAKSSISAAFMETVKHNRSVITDYALNELNTLAHQGMKRVRDANGNLTLVKATEAERMAAYQEILLSKGNNWSAQKLKDAVAQEGMFYDEETGYYYDSEKVRDKQGPSARLSEEEVETRRDRQQIFIDAYKQSKLNIASLSGVDQGQLENGQFQQTTRSAILRDIKGGKTKARRWQTSDLDELQRMIQIFRRTDTFEDLSKPENEAAVRSIVTSINDALDDPRISADIDTRNKELMRVIERYAQNMLDEDVPPTQDEKEEWETAPVVINSKKAPKGKQEFKKPTVKAPRLYHYDAKFDYKNDKSGPTPASEGNDDNNDNL